MVVDSSRSWWYRYGTNGAGGRRAARAFRPIRRHPRFARSGPFRDGRTDPGGRTSSSKCCGWAGEWLLQQHIYHHHLPVVFFLPRGWKPTVDCSAEFRWPASRRSGQGRRQRRRRASKRVVVVWGGGLTKGCGIRGKKAWLWVVKLASAPFCFPRGPARVQAAGSSSSRSSSSVAGSVIASHRTVALA
jgi:hypothetical protein